MSNGRTDPVTRLAGRFPHATQVLTQPVVRVLAIPSSFFAADSVVAGLSGSYAFRTSAFPLRLPLPVGWAIALLVISVTVLAASIWLSPAKWRPPWRQLDPTWLLLAVIWALPWIWQQAQNLVWTTGSASILRDPLLGVQWVSRGTTGLVWWALAAWLLALTVACELLARLRDRDLWFPWFRLLRRYPPHRTLVGAVLTGLLVITALVLAWLPSGDWLARLLACLMLGGLSYLCWFLLGLGTRYEQANAERLAAERFRGELITNVSHDIRTPLTSIVNYVDLLRREPSASPLADQYLEVLDRKSARLKVLISDLLTASQAAGGAVIVHLRELNLTELVGQVAGEFDDDATAAGLTLTMRSGSVGDGASDEPVQVTTDPALLSRVLENLLANAVRYSLPGSRVFLEIEPRPLSRRAGTRNPNAGSAHPGAGLPRRSSSHNPNAAGAQPGAGPEPVRVLIKNTSAAPIDLPGESLTEQFIRGDQARTSDGSGLGLYIAKNLMEQMGGSLEITVTGDLFAATLTLPKAG
ncbi:MAG: HAMP domain-containing histidine kinase [Promicromonosporaceae bacterium]|nr:HAMP domain-containing histidine kinase [Promicromonosporaceae bacterium]